jgi:flagellar biosynthesis/type III secretory pathway M-ring protein FliF/YscJ
MRLKNIPRSQDMSKGNKYLIPIIGVVIAVTLLIGQSGGYLSQKLMVENNIRERVKEALSKLIDSHKYVINIDVELEILDEVNEQITVFSPRESGKRADITPAEKTADALLRIQRKMIEESQPEPASGYSIGLPIPGFEIDVAGEKSQSRSVTQSTPISPRTMEPMDQPTSDDNAQREMVDKVISRKRPSRAEVKRIDLTLILQEGAAPELIENIRQLTMAASKFDRDRGDKFTIMTASFKERRDQRSAEQIMLKNIAEKIDLLEQKRVTENTDWREDIQLYRTEETARRDEDRSFFEGQLAQMEDKAKAQAYAAEKEEMLRRDSLKVAKLNNEISALRDMLQISHKEDVEKQSKVDSSRFALLDNELQGLRRMLLQAMLQDSIDAQKKTQAKIEVELATREKEKASRDSLIEEKIAALEGVQTELDALQAESKDSSQLMLIALGVLALILVGALVFVMGRSRQQQPPIPPWMYPPPRPPKKKKKKAKKEKKTTKEDKEEAPKEEPKEEPAPEAVATPVEAAPEAPEPESQQVIGDDPNVLKSEIDDIRKTVVSMSVGQPGRTSTIVKEWLEQPAPAPPEPEEESGDGDEDDEE